MKLSIAYLHNIGLHHKLQEIVKTTRYANKRSMKSIYLTL